MTTRDTRGRFVSADHAAAERVLEAAVRRAREMIRGWQPCEPMPGYDVASVWTPYDEAAVVAMLRAAGESADLLLGSAS